MHTTFFKATFACFVISFLFSGCRKHDIKPGAPWKLHDGLGVNFGSTVGPAGELFIPDATIGLINRFDPITKHWATHAGGLPAMIPEIGIGGVMDVVFKDNKLYALVTLVDDPAFPTGKINGIYSVDGSKWYSILADIGAFNLANPPTGFDYEVATGVLYSMEVYGDGFLVTDGHLNRVLYVTMDGKISIFKQFDNDVVPTGLEIKGHTVYLAQAGPAPHLPADGKVVYLNNKLPPVTLAAGAPLVVDVEAGRGNILFALSQGIFGGGPDGSPARPGTGSLQMVTPNGRFKKVAAGLNIPTSLEIIGNRAYIMNMGGEIWVVENIAP